MKVIFFNKKDDDDGVIVREWMGPGAPIPANLLTNTRQFINLQHSPILKNFPIFKKIHDFK